MNYTIAIMHDVQFDMFVEFIKDGNRYLVALKNTELMEYTHKTFKNYNEAKEVFNKLSDAILEGMYSYEDRKAMLK